LIRFEASVGDDCPLMNLILLEDNDFLAGTSRVLLNGRRFTHVTTVHRAVVGDRLRVGRIGGPLGVGLVTRLAETELEMEVTFDRAAPEALPLTLVLALPRPKVLRRALQAAATMGVKRIALVASWRVEKSFWSSPALEAGAIREQLLLGLEQGGDTVLPEVLCRRRLKPFVEDELPALARDTTALVGDAGGALPGPRNVGTAVTLAIGPEGGFTPYEIDLFRSHGFTAVSLGPRRLRVEQALPAFVGRLF
jgi:RsmE family RNA methyltransferase